MNFPSKKKIFRFVLIVLAAISLSTYQRMFHSSKYLPEPTGPHKIGRVSFILIDDSRRESHKNAPSQNRSVPINLYYPAAPLWKTHSFVGYSKIVVNGVKDFIHTQFGMPHCLLGWLETLRTHAYYNPPCTKSNEKYPLIFFEHGITSSPDIYTNFIEDLVSHGYIIATITHAYASAGVKTTEGIKFKHAIRWDGIPYPQKYAEREFEQKLWTDDVMFALDEMKTRLPEIIATHYTEALNLIDHIDFSQIGIVGHSFGGSTAAQVCRNDDRFKAGINIDGGLNGPDFLEPFDKPFMFIMNGEDAAKPTLEDINKRGYRTWEEYYDGQLHADKGNQILFDRLQNDKFFIMVEKAGHGTFCDAPLFQEHFWWTRWFLPPTIVTPMNKLCLEFFNHYLKSKDSFSVPSGEKVLVSPLRSVQGLKS